MLTPLCVLGILLLHVFGAVAQLGERMTGSHEVVGSIPISSTRKPIHTADPSVGRFFSQYHRGCP